MNNKLQQIESTKAIAALEQSLCLLMSNIEEAIIVVDKDLRIITFSSEFEKRYFDILEKKVQKGDSVLDYALSVKPNALIEIYNNVFAGETIKQEHETMVGDKYFAYSSIFKPIKDEYGNVVAAFVSSLNLTRQKLNESNIIAESRRYRALIENSFDGICLLGADGKLSYVTPSVSRILGYEMAEIIGINPANFCHPEDNDRIVGLLGALAPKYGETVTATYRMLHKNGSWRWLKANITNLLHEAGLHAFVFNYEDITEQKENEQQKQEIEAKSRAFFENSLDGMLLTVKEGTILAANPAACQMFGMTEEEICNAGRMGLIDISDPRVHKLIEERRLNGKAKGEITFIHKNGTKFPGEITSALFTNINGEERTAMIVRDMTDRVNAEQTKEMVLREKEALMNSTNDLMWSLTKDFKLIACNDAYIKTIKNLTGFTVKPGDDLLIGEPFSADYVSLWDNLYRNVMARNPLKEELYTPPFKNIPQGWAEVSLNPIYSNSEVIGIACYGRDITDMKLQQVALENLNKKLETAQSIARLGYWELDVASTNLTCSLETLNICGFKKNTPLNSGKFFNIIHPEDKEIYKKFRLEAIKNCRQTNIKIRIITPDNILKNVEIRVSANKDLTNCSEKLTGTIQDITEKFNAELQLAKSEQCLKKAQALAHIGSYESNFLTGIDIWSDELYRIFGLEPGELPASFNNFLSFIHPDDVEDFQKTVRQAEADLTMSSYSLRIVRKDGAVRMIYMEGRYVFDANGKPKSLFGTLQDITEHKEAEAENEKLAKLLQSSLNEIYVFNGETLRFEYVNNGALINLGYSKEEMLNKTTLDIKLEFTEQRYRALLNKLDENNEKIIYESFHKRADHSFYPVEVHLQRINVGGPIYKPLYMCVALDITERKVASAKIIESQTYLKTIFDNTKDGFILLNREGIIISHNAIAAETGFLSVDTEMKVGKNIFEFVRENRVEIFKEILEKVLRGETHQYDLAYERFDNNKWLNFTISPVYVSGQLTGICITGRDITERKIAEKKLEQNEKRFRALIENSEDAIVMLDGEGKIIYQSPSTQRIFGFSMQEVQSMSILDLVHPNDKANVEAALKYAFANPGSPQFSTHRVKHKDGSWHWSEGSVSNHLNNENIRAFVINFRDVSQQITYLQDIENQNIILREITWMQSHVVRAPLARIMGLVHLLQSDGLGTMNGQEALDHIITASEELDKVVKEIIRKAEEIEMMTSGNLHNLHD